MSVTGDQINQIVLYMQDQLGHAYTQSNPERYTGPSYDCSGLIYAAFKAAGISIPLADATADPELTWLAQQPGATVITDPSQIQRGDVLGFVGSDAPGGNENVGGHSVTAAGHIGVALGGGQYVSAYDTASGVIDRPIAGGGDNQFIVGVRPAGGGGSSGAGIDSFTGILGFGQDLSQSLNMLLVLSKPQTWFRIIAAIAGIALGAFAVVTLYEAAK